jgi:hypothetical protein
MADPMDEMFNGTPKVNDDAKEEYDYLYEDPLPIGEEQAPSNNTETSPTTNSSKEDKSFIQGVGEEFSKTKPSAPSYVGAAGAGVIDFGIGLLNKIPKKNLPGVHNPFHNDQGKIPSLPAYQDEGLQAVRDISSLVVPTLYLSRFANKGGAAAHAKVKWKLGNDKFVQWISRTGIGVGVGIAVDEIAPVQERDHNAAGWLKQAWPKTWGWMPDDWATLDSDSPEVKRQKNRNEGAAMGFLSDLIAPAARFVIGRRKLKAATNWVPKNETAKQWLSKKNNRIKLSDDPIENDLLQSTKRRDDQLTDLGKSKVEDGADITVPQKGVHDIFDWTETGVRTSDEGGIVSAGIDQARIVKQVDTRYGRVGSILSPRNLREVLTGKENPVKLFKKLGKVLKETEVDYKGTKGQVVKHSDSLREAEALGAALYNTDIEGMKSILRPLSKLDPQTGSRKLSNQAFKGVMEAIKKYSDEFINMDSVRAQGLTGTSVAGQVSDMAEGARLMDGTPAVESSYDQILDRLEFLMNLQGQTTFLRKEAMGLHDIINRIKRAGNELNPSSTTRSIKEETNTTLRALEDIANESRQTVETLRNIKAERPHMLGPLMLAYEVTDGKVSSMSALNTYIRNTTGTVSKAFFDARADMPSAWTQGVWANIYNSVLSAVGTPLKAALSNTVLMIERPLATFAGAILQGDWKSLRRAHYMYNIGVGDTLQRSFAHMNQIFKRASVDPSSVGYIMRDDIARKNAGQMDLLRSFSDAAEIEGNYGPSIITNQIEAMNDLAEHPAMRFSANAMTGFDGFTRSYIANIEARGRAYDKLMQNGGQLSANRVRAMARNVYSEMFDETGMITDKAVEYASREIAMNLDSPAVSALNEMVRMVPAIKPFMMFPKTSTNMIRFAGSHNPLGTFINQVNDFKLPFNQMNIEDVKQLLAGRGVGNVENIEAAYDTIRAELKGRKAIGTLSVMGAGILFTQDRITGNGIYDKTRQRTRRELGWKPKSFKGLDGKWYSYENLGALTDWLALTADVMDNYVEGTLDEPTTELMFNKIGFILSANLTDKTFTAGLEPLGDVLAGNPAAAARWAGSFGSALIPGSGFRNEFSRLLEPQLKEVDQELNQIIANRNPGTREQLPDVYDWMDGSKVGEPLGFFARVWNTYSPLWKVSEAITPEKQFLMDIEFDGRPSLRTNGKGIEYSPAQRSEVTRIMGENKYFAKEVKRIMQSTDGKEFRRQWKLAADQGAYLDRTLLDNIHYNLTVALKAAQREAEAHLSDYDDIKEKQFINYEVDRATRLGDVQRILELQQN